MDEATCLDHSSPSSSTYQFSKAHSLLCSRSARSNHYSSNPELILMTWRIINELPTENTIGKVLERLAQMQIRHHIEGSPNIGSQQSAYCAFHSTETAVVRVVSNLHSSTNSECFSSCSCSTLVLHSTSLTRICCTNERSYYLAFLTLYCIGLYAICEIINSMSLSVMFILYPSNLQRACLRGWYSVLFIFTTPVGDLFLSMSSESSIINKIQYADDTRLIPSTSVL